MWKWLSEHLYVNTYISEYLDKCEQVWWTDVEDEASTSDKHGNMYCVYSMYSTYSVQYM